MLSFCIIGQLPLQLVITQSGTLGFGVTDGVGSYVGAGVAEGKGVG